MSQQGHDDGGAQNQAHDEQTGEEQIRDKQAVVLASELSSALKELHRALIRAEIGDDPSLQNPYSALFALIGDPRFGWMDPLAQLIVHIDEQVAEKEITSMEMLVPLHRQAALLIGEEKTADALPDGFRLRHVMALQKEPEAGLATGRLRKVLNGISSV